MASGDKAPMQGVSDLDSLIHSLEFENQQYVKMIEKENQRLQFLERQEEDKSTEISQLQSLTADLDTNTKRNHRQLVHNRNTLESLIKTKSVLVAHLDALQKQMEMLLVQNKSQQEQFQETLQNYQTIWADYKAKYMSLPLVQKLASEEACLARSQVEHHRRLQQKRQLQQRIQAATDELDFQNWQRFCIKIAEKRLSTDKKIVDLNMAIKEKMVLQTQLHEIQERNQPTLTEVDQQAEEHDEIMDLDSGEANKNRSGSHPEDTSATVSASEDTGSTSGTTTDDTCIDENGNSDKITHGVEKETDMTSAGEGRGILLNQTYTVKSRSAVSVESAGAPCSEKVQSVTASEDQEDMDEDTSSAAMHFASVETGDSSPQGHSPQQMAPPQPSSASGNGINTGRCNISDPPQTQEADQTLNKKRGSAALPADFKAKMPTRTAPSKIPTVKSAVSAILMGVKPSTSSAQMQVPRTPLTVPRPVVPSSPRVSQRSEVSAPGTPGIQHWPPTISTPQLTPRPPIISSPVPRQRLTTSTSRPSVLQSPARSQADQVIPCDSVSSHASVSSGSKRQNVPTASAPILAVPKSPSVREVKGPGTPRIVPAPPVPAVTVPVSQLPQLVRLGTVCTSVAGNQTGRQTSQGTSAQKSPPLLSDAGDSAHGPLETAQSDRGDSNQDEDMDTDTDSRGSQPQCTTPPSTSPGSQGKFPLSPFDFDKHQKRLRELKDSPTYLTFPQRATFSTSSTTEKPAAAFAASTVSTPPTNSPVFRLGFSSPTTQSEQPLSSLFSCVPSAIPMSSSSKANSPDRSERGGSFFSFEAMDTNESSGGLSLLSMFGKSAQEPKESTFSFNFNQSSTSVSDSGFSFSFGGSDSGGNENKTGSLFTLF